MPQVANSILWMTLAFVSPNLVFDPDLHIPKPNRTLIYLGACMIAGIRLAREKQVNVRVIPTSHAIEESVEVAHEIFNRIYRRVPGCLPQPIAIISYLFSMIYGAPREIRTPDLLIRSQIIMVLHRIAQPGILTNMSFICKHFKRVV